MLWGKVHAVGLAREGCTGLVGASLSAKRLTVIPFLAPYIIPSFAIDIRRQVPEALIC